MLTKKRWKLNVLFVSLIAVMIPLAGCNDDNDDAMNDSIYTDPQNGANDNNDILDNDGDGVNNELNNVPGEKGNNEINEGTIQDNGTFEDEAREIIDDTEDMIEGKDDHVHDDKVEDKR